MGMGAPAKRLTKDIVENAPKKEKPYVVWDAELRGLGLRVQPSGTKTFILRYRPSGTGRQGPKRFLKIGPYGLLAPDQARAKAKVLLGQIADGRDPAAELAKARAAITVADLADRYLRDEVTPKRKPRTLELYTYYFNRFITPEIGKTKAEAVTRATVAKLHLKIGRTHQVSANRVLDTISGLFTFGGRHDLLPAGFINPAKGIEKFKETAHERYLTGEELERLGAAIREAETIGIPWDVDEAKSGKHLQKTGRITIISPFAAAAIRLLILTGARLREVLHLRWSEVDFERGMLHLGDSKTGKKSIVLNAPALAVIAPLPRLGAYVIAGDDPEAPRADLQRPWDVVRRRAGLEGLRLHDLRHSFASVGAGASLGLPIIGKLLGHASTTTT
jgi:integrase